MSRTLYISYGKNSRDFYKREVTIGISIKWEKNKFL